MGNALEPRFMNFLVSVLKDVDVYALWFLQGGATYHTVNEATNLFHETFGELTRAVGLSLGRQDGLNQHCQIILLTRSMNLKFLLRETFIENNNYSVGEKIIFQDVVVTSQ